MPEVGKGPPQNVWWRNINGAKNTFGTRVANDSRDALFAIRYASAVATSPFFEARFSN